MKPDNKNTCEGKSSILSAFDSMFNFTQDAVVLFDLNLNIIRSNQKFNDLPNSHPASSGGENVFNFFGDKENQDKLLSVFEGNVIKTEIRLKDPEGKDNIILSAKSGPVKEEGEIVGGYVIFDDITEFINRENLLNKRLKLISRMVEKANLGIIMIDQDHKVVEANQRFCEMIGYSQSEIANLHAWDWEYNLDENRIRQIFTNLSEINSTFESVHRRKDGTTYDVEIFASGSYVLGDEKDVIMFICADISAKKEMEKKLRLSETKFKTYIENAADMILTVDNDGKISYISPNCENICGFTVDEIINKSASDFFVPEKAEPEKDSFNMVFMCDNNTYQTFSMKHKDGSLHWYGVTISKTSDVNGKDILICNTRNIDKLKENENKLVHLSLYDHLTGIPNRAFFDAMLERSQLSRHRPLSLLMCDLDYLKTINDTYGHAKGDEVLQKTAQLIQSSLRKEDFIARIGGDEFAVILPGADSKETLVVIERISETFNDYNSDKGDLAINISIGFSTVKDTETSLEDALYKADKKMYCRKQINKSLSEL